MKVDLYLKEIFSLIFKPLLEHKSPNEDDISFLESCLETHKISIRQFLVTKGDTYIVRRRISFRNTNYVPDKVKLTKHSRVFVRKDERLDYWEVEVTSNSTVDSTEYRFSEFEFLRFLANAREILCAEDHVASDFIN